MFHCAPGGTTRNQGRIPTVSAARSVNMIPRAMDDAQLVSAGYWNLLSLSSQVYKLF